MEGRRRPAEGGRAEDQPVKIVRHVSEGGKHGRGMGRVREEKPRRHLLWGERNQRGGREKGGRTEDSGAKDGDGEKDAGTPDTAQAGGYSDTV